MIPEYERMIGVRISKKDFGTIERLIEKGHFKSVTQIARTALIEFLAKYPETTPEASRE
jgi:Arc/MetJ-type ribon-helix-helix transcriptional regulator